MWQTEVSVDIEAPVERVYRRLSDLAQHAAFSAGLARVEQITPGPVVVGTRYRAQETVPGRYVSESEITALEPPRRIAWRASVKGIMRTEWELQLTPTAAGTRLVQVSRWEPASPIGFAMLNLHRRRHAPAENRQTLERIRSVLELEAPQEVRS